MARYQKSNSAIQVHSRALLFQGENIILCRAKKNDVRNWYFLPGGHVETGESAGSALLRELAEEIGISNYKIISFIGICENVFPLKENILQQEINIIFEVNVPANLKIQSQEKHLEFISINQKDLKNYNILPPKLKDKIIQWLNNKKPFFIALDNKL